MLPKMVAGGERCMHDIVYTSVHYSNSGTQLFNKVIKRQVKGYSHQRWILSLTPMNVLEPRTITRQMQAGVDLQRVEEGQLLDKCNPFFLPTSFINND